MTVTTCTNAAPLPNAPTTMEVLAADAAGAPMAVPTQTTSQVAPVDQVGATGGGAVGQALQGADQQRLIAALEQVVVAVSQLVAALQAQQVQQAQQVPGGGAVDTGCAMPGCDTGAVGAVPVTAQVSYAGPSVGAAPIASVGGTIPVAGLAQSPAPQVTAGPAPQVTAGPAPAQASAPAPARDVKDRASTNGLSAAAMRGLDEAHRFGLPLVSGHRPGGPSYSDHTTGNAIDVSTLPIGAASSTEGTPDMKSFAEHMRQAGKAGRLNVKYVILDGRIASATNNWEWREYTYPGKTAAEMAALKQSNRGEYNRMQHYDHVHVSFS